MQAGQPSVNRARGPLAEASGPALSMLHDIGKLRHFDSQTHENKGQHLIAS
jgi:hypothetical protein